ncbi:glutathione S-transferase family protein [Amaricoccus sp.]|uniref:glutathione S-transferase family protein n=1 Tax=Amaricoccus sp. TaxID=1872485 RepID=UPI001B536143|nr:glutathione S-transferase family protein [Amaricoccus sp.]MBP7003101.1 glutathione S-transferase family protein [Amaricoccus sp.]
MDLVLYGHPFSSYCQKVLVALDELGLAFTFRVLGSPDDPEANAEFAALWPIRRMPVLVDEGRTVVESSVIVEHLSLRAPGPARLLPGDPQAALESRKMDRFFDNYVMAPMQKVVLDHLRPEGERDAYGVAEARRLLDAAYGWLDGAMEGRAWAAGAEFGLADCAAAPSLFYADWVHPIPEDLARTRAFRARLLARPSMARAVDAARPYRPYFPPGAPDRD